MSVIPIPAPLHVFEDDGTDKATPGRRIRQRHVAERFAADPLRLRRAARTVAVAIARGGLSVDDLIAAADAERKLAEAS